MGTLVDAGTLLPHEAVRHHRTELLGLAEQCDLSDVRLFGSALREDDGLDSDVDLLVKVGPQVGLMELAEFCMRAEDLLGFPVDVVSDRPLKPDHRIVRTAVPL